jgi:choline dehydrogenase-like flavoprotein
VSDYDVIVVGGGSPGEHCAGALAEGGLRVAVVERELVGGECSYWACIPSKTLLRPGEAVHGAREAVSKAEVDVDAALAWRDFMVSNYSDAGQERWRARASRCCAAPAASPAWARSRSTASATPQSTSSWRTALSRSSRRFRVCASSRAFGPTARRPA